MRPVVSLTAQKNGLQHGVSTMLTQHLYTSKLFKVTAM
jgi:hypothetical protein